SAGAWRATIWQNRQLGARWNMPTPIHSWDAVASGRARASPAQPLRGESGGSAETPPKNLERVPLARLRPDLHEHPDDVRIELAGPGPFEEDPERLGFLERRLVGPPRPQRVVHVHHRHDAGQVGDLLAHQLVRVASAVDPLVVVAEERPGQGQ